MAKLSWTPELRGKIAAVALPNPAAAPCSLLLAPAPALAPASIAKKPLRQEADTCQGNLMKPTPIFRSVALAALTTLALALALAIAGPARADVTVDQKMTMTLAGMNIDITSTERTSADKQRTDSTTQCHGFLALFCRNVQSGEIRRLDKQLEWDLQPKARTCIEHDFPTAEQRAQAQQQFEATMAQMKACPMPQQSAQTGPDTSHCQMSAPKVDVQQSADHATLIGHDAHRTTVTLSQTCTDPQSGHVCQFDYGFDMWLTSDALPGLSEQRDFQQKYMAAQGLDPNNPQLRGMAQQLLAPYADTLKQLQTQGATVQGFPLRSTFFLDYGGPQCGNAQSQQQQQQAQQPARHHGLLGSIAGNAVGTGLSGLFHRSVNIPTSSVAGEVAANATNQTADAAAAGAANATATSVANASAAHGEQTAAAGPVPPPTPAGMVRMVSMSTEITAIDTSSIDATQFDLPSGYTIQQPAPAKKDRPVCPANEAH